MVVVQYNHTGKVYLSGASTQDANGNWPEGGATLTLETMCRAEARTESQYLVGQGGQHIVFNSIVYMPIPEVEIKPGMLFEVWDGERLITKEDVKQFSKGQLNARVWL